MAPQTQGSPLPDKAHWVPSPAARAAPAPTGATHTGLCLRPHPFPPWPLASQRSCTVPTNDHVQTGWWQGPRWAASWGLRQPNPLPVSPPPSPPAPAPSLPGPGLSLKPGNLAAPVNPTDPLPRGACHSYTPSPPALWSDTPNPSTSATEHCLPHSHCGATRGSSASQGRRVQPPDGPLQAGPRADGHQVAPQLVPPREPEGTSSQLPNFLFSLKLINTPPRFWEALGP